MTCARDEDLKAIFDGLTMGWIVIGRDGKQSLGSARFPPIGEEVGKGEKEYKEEGKE